MENRDNSIKELRTTTAWALAGGNNPTSENLLKMCEEKERLDKIKDYAKEGNKRILHHIGNIQSCVAAALK